MFTGLIAATAIVLALAMLHAWATTRDPFHPMLLLGGLLGFMYVFMPAHLDLSDPHGLRLLVSDEQLVRVQTINLLGVAALCAGVLHGAAAWTRAPGHLWEAGPPLAARLRQGGWALGAVGLCAFVYAILQVGGLEAAYGQPYGGGWSDSGYVRDAAYLTLPALLLLLMGQTNRQPTWMALAGAVVLASPFWLHGLLGARRGPTFVAGIGLLVGWYLARHRRPSLALAAIVGLLVGMLMLLLIANRSLIFLGGELTVEQGPLAAIRAEPGNEYATASARILDTESRGAFGWGANYLVVLLVRPIPRQLWPTKYEDAALALGIHDIEAGNIGIAGDRFMEAVGWTIPMGSAHGIVADMWIELWWLALGALFAFGWAYGRCWAGIWLHGRLWIPLYAMLAAHAAFLVTQSLEAWITRMLVVGVPAWLVWTAAERAARERGWWVPPAARQGTRVAAR